MKIILQNKINFTLILFSISIILLSTGCSEDKNYPWYVEKMKLNDAWKVSTGNGITIAFIDTGISKEYYDRIPNRIVSPYNVLTKNTDVTDKIGHGTELIAAACGSKEEMGVYGIAPKTKIMPILVSDGTGHMAPDNLAEGIKWAISHGANIINLSIGSNINNENVENEITNANKNNIIVIASSGDYSQRDLLFPAKMPNVISVASQDKSGKMSTFSNYAENKISILMPGEAIETVSVDVNGKNVNQIVKGTSIACSLMSGIIALALEVEPKSSFDTLSKALEIASNNSKSGFINVNDFLSYIKNR